MNIHAKYVIHADIDKGCRQLYIKKCLCKCHETENVVFSAPATFAQVYLSILYLRIPETFKIVLRGMVVEQHNIADDLMHPQYILYKPYAAGRVEVRKLSGGFCFLFLQLLIYFSPVND